MKRLKAVLSALALAFFVAFSCPAVALAEDVALTPEEHWFLRNEVMEGSMTRDFDISLNASSAIHIYLETFSSGSSEIDGDDRLTLQLRDVQGNIIDSYKSSYSGYKSLPLPAGSYVLRLIQSAPASFSQSVSFSAWASTFYSGTNYQVFLPNNRDVASASSISLDKKVAGRFEWWEAGSEGRFYDRHYFKFTLSEPTNVQVHDFRYQQGETKMSLVDANGSEIKSITAKYDPTEDIYNSYSFDCGQLQPGTHYLCYESVERPRYDHNAIGNDFQLEFLVGHEMYRMYNPNSHEHLYTASPEERDTTIRNGWKYEGIMWYAPAKSSQPVYRLYNPNTGDHHYTYSQAEYETLGGIGWKKENIVFYSVPCDDNSTSGKPVYRLFNPNQKGSGTHHYTASIDECNANERQGWRCEGVGWAGLFWEEGYFWTNDLL